MNAVEAKPAGVGGVKVSIVAFQAIDPGSIPGRRTFLLFFCRPLYLNQWHKDTASTML